MNSLLNKNQQLEHELERAEEKIKDLKALEDDEDDWRKDQDAAQRKIILLEQELEKSELAVRDTTKK